MANSIEVRTNVKFKPWTAPNYAVLDLGDASVATSDNQGRSIAIKDLTDEALAAMAEAWLDDLYNKADKRSPFQLPAMP